MAMALDEEHDPQIDGLVPGEHISSVRPDDVTSCLLGLLIVMVESTTENGEILVEYNVDFTLTCHVRSSMIRLIVGYNMV